MLDNEITSMKWDEMSIQCSRLIRLLLLLAIAGFVALSIFCSTQYRSERFSAIDDSPPMEAINKDSIWQQTTRWIYADSPHRQRWLDESPLKVFIYDTLEDQFSVPHVSQCIEKRFAVTPPKCGYYPKICNDSDKGMLGKVHHNYNSDVIIIQRFLQYAYRTMDPNEADVFFVPYPHKSHCPPQQCAFRTVLRPSVSWLMHIFNQEKIWKIEPSIYSFRPTDGKRSNPWPITLRPEERLFVTATHIRELHFRRPKMQMTPWLSSGANRPTRDSLLQMRSYFWPCHKTRQRREEGKIS